MAAPRCLIVNADDFGASPGVNRGIVEAHRRGIVTSASLMVRQPAASDAAARWRDCDGLGLGLHLDVGEWAYRGGEWVTLYEVVPPHDAAATAAEAHRQLDAFCTLAGTDPTHIDSHQHAHTREPLRTVATSIANELGVPLRHVSRGVCYRGEFYGQTSDGSPIAGAISVRALLALLATLAPGVSELACHPGYGAGLDSMYVAERELEVRVLCAARVRAAVRAQGIELRSFAGLKREGRCV